MSRSVANGMRIARIVRFVTTNRYPVRLPKPFLSCRWPPRSFAFHDLYKQSRGRLIPLFAITPKGQLRIFTAQDKLEPNAGWTVLSFSADVPGEHRP